MNFLKKVWNDEEGQGFAEYALILFFITLVVIVALTPLGTTIKKMFNDITKGLGGTGSA